MRKSETLLLLVVGSLVIMDIKSGHNEYLKVMSCLLVPYVHTMAEQNTDSPDKQALDLMNYVYFGGPKPVWFTNGETEDFPAVWRA